MRRARVWIALASALMLGACSFSAERPLFGPDAGAHPFADNTLVEMRSGGRTSDVQRMVFRVAGGGYDIAEPPPGKGLMRGLVFVPVEATPFEDYVLQFPMDEDSPGVAFAFVWRTRDRYRMILDPNEFRSSPAARAWLAAHCNWRPDSDCVFTAAADVLAFHSLFVTPIYIREDKAPGRFYELAPIAVVHGRKRPPPSPAPR
jgi:hypothetical protein